MQRAQAPENLVPAPRRAASPCAAGGAQAAPQVQRDSYLRVVIGREAGGSSRRAAGQAGRQAGWGHRRVAVEAHIGAKLGKGGVGWVGGVGQSGSRGGSLTGRGRMRDAAARCTHDNANGYPQHRRNGVRSTGRL